MAVRILLVDASPLRASRFALALRRVPGIAEVELAVLTRRIRDTIVEVQPKLVIVVSDETCDGKPAHQDFGPAGPGLIVRYLPSREVQAYLDASMLAMSVAPATVAVANQGIGTQPGAADPGKTGFRSVFSLLSEIEAIAATTPKNAAPGGARPHTLPAPAILPAPSASPAGQGMPIVCIGASTGGLPVIEGILRTYPPGCPPTLIVQHIRGSFTSCLADRMSRLCRSEVTEAFEDAPIEPGRVYLAPGDVAHLEVSDGASRAGANGPPLRCRLVEADKVSGHRPSVDALFRSAARHGPRTIGVLLTGMGRDGAEGLLEIRRGGGRTVAQDAESSVVYGMPRVAAELGAVQHVLPAHEIGPAILRLCGMPSENKGSIRA